MHLKEEEKGDSQARKRIVKAGMDAALMAQPPLFYSKKDASLIEIGNLEFELEQEFPKYFEAKYKLPTPDNNCAA